MPWEASTKGKYQYHPGGDPSAAPKDAPSAVNVVVIPEVNLPKVRSKDPRKMRAEECSYTTTGASREVEQVGQGRLLNAFFRTQRIYCASIQEVSGKNL